MRIQALLMVIPVYYRRYGGTRRRTKVVKVSPDRYRGTWLEIGRTPTDGCVF